MQQDHNHRFSLMEGLPDIWADVAKIGMREADFMPGTIAQPFSDAYDRCVALQQEQLLEFTLVHAGRAQIFEARVSPNDDGVLTIMTDVTDQRDREAAMEHLLREVSHRSKNLLAIVQSVAMQTAHHSDDIHDFLAKFRGRLHALSSTQDLVTESNWRGTYLQDLVTSQLARVSHGVLANMRITGSNPLLGPNASLHIGLALHELAANTVLHGALSGATAGNIWLDARIGTPPGEPPDLVIEWQETGIDGQRVRHRPSFGTLVLERIVPLSVGGTADFRLQGEQLRYRLTVPADQFEA